MPDEADLPECTLPVAGDDHLTAMDTGRAVQRTDGGALGPVGHENQALVLIETGPPPCAVVDINLGDGLRFAVSEALLDTGIPFVFVTGYDVVVIPSWFDGVERLRKLFAYGEVTRTPAKLGRG